MTLAMNSTVISGTPRQSFDEDHREGLDDRHLRAPPERQQDAERQRRDDAGDGDNQRHQQPAPLRGFDRLQARNRCQEQHRPKSTAAAMSQLRKAACAPELSAPRSWRNAEQAASTPMKNAAANAAGRKTAERAMPDAGTDHETTPARQDAEAREPEA